MSVGAPAASPEISGACISSAAPESIKRDNGQKKKSMKSRASPMSNQIDPLAPAMHDI